MICLALSVDYLLLGLTHHWSRDRSIFPTENDQLDLPTIMLFQAYTACRLAELVGSKSRGGKDPLLDDRDGDGVADSVDTSRNDTGDDVGDMESDSEGGEEDDEEDNDSVFDDDDGYDSDVIDDTDLDDDEFDDNDRNHNAEAVDADDSNRPEVDKFGTARNSQRAIGKSSFNTHFAKVAERARHVQMVDLYQKAKTLEAEKAENAVGSAPGSLVDRFAERLFPGKWESRAKREGDERPGRKRSRTEYHEQAQEKAT